MNGEKKKLVIVGALFFLMIGVGVFQFTKSDGSKAATSTKVKSDDKAVAVTEKKADDSGPKNPQVAALLPKRDPFKTEPIGDGPRIDPVPPTSSPAANSQQSRPLTRPSILGAGPDPMVGKLPDPSRQVPPLNPAAGSQPGMPKEEVKPMFTLNGVLIGERTVAVISDSEGHQRMVAVGAKLDKETRVVSIQKNKVTIRTGNRTTTLSAGGNDNGK
ncbi:MAG: hypothetical protein JSS72_04295 [Armatimonadetes bacterium]|nr:hypothetical protein [Armatimonadota bacterium]